MALRSGWENPRDQERCPSATPGGFEMATVDLTPNTDSRWYAGNEPMAPRNLVAIFISGCSAPSYHCHLSTAGVYQIGEDQPRCCSTAGTSLDKGRPFSL